MGPYIDRYAYPSPGPYCVDDPTLSVYEPAVRSPAIAARRATPHHPYRGIQHPSFSSNPTVHAANESREPVLAAGCGVPRRTTHGHRPTEWSHAGTSRDRNPPYAWNSRPVEAMGPGSVVSRFSWTGLIMPLAGGIGTLIVPSLRAIDMLEL